MKKKKKIELQTYTCFVDVLEFLLSDLLNVGNPMCCMSNVHFPVGFNFLMSNLECDWQGMSEVLLSVLLQYDLNKSLDLL